MLIVDQYSQWTRQEAAMSSIYVPTAAGQGGKLVRREFDPAAPQAPSGKTRSQESSHDQEMMYAWSIGVSSTVRTLRTSRQPEECPPEVYIG